MRKWFYFNGLQFVNVANYGTASMYSARSRSYCNTTVVAAIPQ
jgi:hypothetical protein